MLIIGSKNSSNTKELYEVAKENCKDVYLINDIQKLSGINFNVSDKIGIVGGASTPKEMLEHVKNYLQNKRNSL